MAKITAFGRALKALGGSEQAMASAVGYTRQAINVAKKRGRFSRNLAVKLSGATGVSLRLLLEGWKTDKRNGALRPVK
jgi:hypothetical protein